MFAPRHGPLAHNTLCGLCSVYVMLRLCAIFESVVSVSTCWGRLDSIHQVSLIVRPSPHICILLSPLFPFCSLVTVSVLLCFCSGTIDGLVRLKPSRIVFLISPSDSSLRQNPMSNFLMSLTVPLAERKKKKPLQFSSPKQFM